MAQQTSNVSSTFCLRVFGGVHASTGAQWQQLKDYGELDMADPATLAGFLQRGLARCAQRLLHLTQQLLVVCRQEQMTHARHGPAAQHTGVPAK